jgi:RNA polymerase sigma-70 factor, ECF subfamily
VPASSLNDEINPAGHKQAPAVLEELRTWKMSTEAERLEFQAGAPREGDGRENVPLPPLGIVGSRAQPSFHAIYLEHVHFVWRSLRLLGVPLESLEDAVQDTFAVVAQKLPSFEGRSAVATWIFGVVQRVAANHRRRHRRKLAPLLPLDRAVVCSDPTPEGAVEAVQAAAAIERFCQQLSDDRRRLFILALLEEIPMAELAAGDDVSVNTLYSRVRALRLELRRFLDLDERTAGPLARTVLPEVDDD